MNPVPTLEEEEVDIVNNNKYLKEFSQKMTKVKVFMRKNVNGIVNQ